MDLRKFNRCLAMFLFLGCLLLFPLANDKKKSNLKSSQIVLKLNGNVSTDPELLEFNPKINLNEVLPQIKNSQNQPNKDRSSSSSASKNDQSNLYLGNKLRPSSNGNPSGSGNNGFDETEWEAKASCVNPDDVISNPNFWNSYLNSKDCCPNIDMQFEDQEEWNYENEKLIEIPDEILSKQRRKLLAASPLPTAKLDGPVKSTNNFSTFTISPFTYYSKEGKILTIKNWELEKIVYAHSYDLDLINFADRIVCPIQPDPTKFSREECRAITDRAKKEALVKILDLTTTVDPNYITRKMPMPSYPPQDSLAYIDTLTRNVVFFHADGGKLWSAARFSQLELNAVLNNPKYKNLD